MTEHIKKLVEAVLDEDLGAGDLTAGLIPASARTEAQLICRESAILCGREWFDEAFSQLDLEVQIDWQAEEGSRLSADQLVCRISGNARSILTAERSAINLLQTLSGTATVARQYADQLEGLHTQVLDTRKTIPGLRLAQKYAARTGGAANHRVGLYDGVLIKENHIRAAGSISAALEQAIHSTPEGALLEIEVESLSELREALDAGAKRVLLDNFSLEQLGDAVAMRPADAAFEASGNVTLDSLRAIAQTGVDYISVGAMTKHLHAVDFSLQFTLDL